MSRNVSKPVISTMHFFMGQRYIWFLICVFQQFPFLVRVVINSLPLIPNYEEWKDRRRTFDNAFTRKCVFTSTWHKLISFVHRFLRSLVPHFNVVAKDHLLHSILLKASKGGVVMMKREFSEATLEAISTVSLKLCLKSFHFIKKMLF